MALHAYWLPGLHLLQVESIALGGIAEATGQIFVGDKVVSINGEDVYTVCCALWLAFCATVSVLLCGACHPKYKSESQTKSVLAEAEAEAVPKGRDSSG